MLSTIGGELVGIVLEVFGETGCHKAPPEPPRRTQPVLQRPLEHASAYRIVLPHREPIEAVLERHDLWAVAETGEGEFELLGPLGDGHRLIWSAVESEGVLPTARAVEMESSTLTATATEATLAPLGPNGSWLESARASSVLSAPDRMYRSPVVVMFPSTRTSAVVSATATATARPRDIGEVDALDVASATAVTVSAVIVASSVMMTRDSVVDNATPPISEIVSRKSIAVSRIVFIGTITPRSMIS